MKNILVRSLSGAVYVGLIVASILLGFECFWVLILALAILSVIEIQNLFSVNGRILGAVRALDLVSLAVLLSASWIINVNSSANLVDILFCLSAIFLIIYMPLRILSAVADKSEGSLRNVFCSLLSLIYVGLPLLFLEMAYLLPEMGSKLVLTTFIYIWLNDTGAYITGISFGKHRLCERLSPKKSWEGFWGGFCFCLIAGALTPLFIRMNVENAWLLWMVYAAVVSVMSTFGDLFESLIKRRFGVKDSGKLIPGHGGVLDRIDSLLAVTPITFIFGLLMYMIHSTNIFNW